MEAEQELSRVELVIGRVVGAEDLAGARGPSYRLTLDLGPRGRREATLELPRERTKEELLGRQLVCALSGDEALVVAARSHAHGLVLLAPEEEVEDGTAVG